MPSNIDTVTIFGVNPETNNFNELHTRVKRLEKVLIEDKPSRVIFLGGESWISGDRTVTEAGVIAERAEQQISGLLPNEIVELPYGLETISQTHVLMDYMSSNNIQPGNMKMISTWHQLLRSATIFLTRGYDLPTMSPLPSEGTASDIAYDVCINAFAGVGYTLLSELLQKRGLWTDGGPLVKKINEERKEKQNFSWFNTRK